MTSRAACISSYLAAALALLLGLGWAAGGFGEMTYVPGQGTMAQTFVGGLRRRVPVASTLVHAASVLAAVGCAFLAIRLHLRARKLEAARLLGNGFAWTAFFLAYVFIAFVAPPFDGYQPPRALRWALDGLAFFVLSLALYAFSLFWMRYPRPITPEEVGAFVATDFQTHEQREFGWLYRFYGRLHRGWDAQRAAQARFEIRARSIERTLRFMATPRYLAALVLLMALPMAFLWTPSSTFTGGLAGGLLGGAIGGAMGTFGWHVLRYHRATGNAEERRRIEWVWMSVAVTAAMIAIAFVVAAVARGLGSWFPALGVSGKIWAAVSLAGILLAPYVFVLGVGLSILYRGGLDPRVAMRRVTIWTVLGIAMTFIFVAIEHAVAAHAAQWMQLPEEVASIFALAAVAATFHPIRKMTEKRVTHWMERLLPPSVLAAGTRHEGAIAVVEIEGYDGLLERDEQAALLASALLQRECRRLAGQHEGHVAATGSERVVLVFDAREGAIAAVEALRASAIAGFAALGIDGLALRTGLHWGEYTELREGEAHGRAVSVAAAMARRAKPGAVVASEVFSGTLPGQAPAVPAMAARTRDG